MSLKFVKLSSSARTPTRGSSKAAGFDLYSAHSCVVKARSSALIKTDLQVEVPEGTYGRIAPRSGLALRMIDIGGGVIDADYRGNVAVILFNHNNEDFEIKPGDRIAQLICQQIIYPELEEVKKLDDTTRGDGGFGSTGI